MSSEEEEEEEETKQATLFFCGARGGGGGGGDFFKGTEFPQNSLDRDVIDIDVSSSSFVVDGEQKKNKTQGRKGTKQGDKKNIFRVPERFVHASPACGVR